MSAPAKFKTICRKKGCEAEQLRRQFPDGNVPVCKSCGKCANHCRHESFSPAADAEDLALGMAIEKEDKAQAEVDAQ